MDIPRLLIAGLSGGSGKTLFSLGLTRAWQQKGLAVKVYKKGPDYIDAAWLALAGQRPVSNLDPFFLNNICLKALFMSGFAEAKADIALVEGNRGLFDGRDVQGSCSTMALAHLLDIPVILAMDCSKMTRTAAAIVQGVHNFQSVTEKGNLAGVILNNMGSARHETQVRQALAMYTDVPVFGALPRQKNNPLPERHMGLSLSQNSTQREETEKLLDALALLVRQHADIETLLDLAQDTKPMDAPDSSGRPDILGTAGAEANTEYFWQVCGDNGAQKTPVCRIGYVRDDALWFYYEENLKALERAGAELVELSLLNPKPWPHVDGLYLGGGFPELFAGIIAQSPHLSRIREMAESGQPVYAECGGFMVLATSLSMLQKTHTMAGILPVSTRFFPKPQGLGYVEAKTDMPNAFHPVGCVWRGHEFHYSRAEYPPETLFALTLLAGHGMGKQNNVYKDGLVYKNVFASYTHLFAPSVPHWAKNFVACAVRQTKNFSC